MEAEDEEKKAGSGPENDSDPEFNEEIAYIYTESETLEVSDESDGEADLVFEQFQPRTRRSSTRSNDFGVERPVYTSSGEE